MSHPHTRDYTAWRSLLGAEKLPCALVDLDAVDANLETLLAARQNPSVTLRIATKSIRNPFVLRYLLDRGQGHIQGLMTWSADEVRALAAEGFDDFLMGYPCARPDEAAVLAQVAASGKRVIAVVDCEAHLEILSHAAADAQTVLPVCVDLDMAWRPLGGRLHMGVQRSPLRTVEAVMSLAQQIRQSPHLKLVAVLAYEAQIAGMADTNTGSRHLDPVRRWIKRGSKPEVLAFRAGALAALKAEGFEIGLVNGGGTGSVGWSSADPAVTEVTVGSGFLAPTLFDGYAGLSLRPGLVFALGVCRVPEPGVVTCFGGGYIASGAGGEDRWPSVYAPEGAKALPMEGFGEVQTPIKLPRALRGAVGVGDPVVCRPAKAGELAERFSQYAMVRGEQIVSREPTYRGFGWCFG